MLERELACEVSDISCWLRKFAYPIKRVGLEAGMMGQHLFFGLQAEGFDVVCMEARQMNAALSAMRNKTIDLSNEVRGLLKIFDLRLPKTVSHRSFEDIVGPMMQMDEVHIHAQDPLLDARVALYQHYLELDRRVNRTASHDEVCMRLMTVPGVGPIAARLLLSHAS